MSDEKAAAYEKNIFRICLLPLYLLFYPYNLYKLVNPPFIVGRLIVYLFWQGL